GVGGADAPRDPRRAQGPAAHDRRIVRRLPRIQPLHGDAASQGAGGGGAGDRAPQGTRAVELSQPPADQAYPRPLDRPLRRAGRRYARPAEGGPRRLTALARLEPAAAAARTASG